MARQESVIKFNGQMGGMSFYKTKAGFLVRTKGGVSATRIKNDPAFERTRENGAEFGRAGAAAKLLRTSLRVLLMHSADGRMSSRLTRSMVQVVRADSASPRGLRQVSPAAVGMLQGFEFNQDGKLSRTLFAPYTTGLDRVAGNIWVEIPAFVPGNRIAAPQGATHVKLVAAGVEVDFTTGQYGVNTSESALLELGSQNQPALQLDNAVTPGSDKPLFLAFGIEFYQEVNGQWYPLKNGAFNALSLVLVNGGV